MGRCRESGSPLEGLRHEEGFTLLELLVVMMILGILSAIAIPAFLGMRDRAEEAAARSSLRHVILGIEMASLDPEFSGSVDVRGVAVVAPDVGSRASDQVAMDIDGREGGMYLLVARANRNCVDAIHRRWSSTTWSSRTASEQPACYPVVLGIPSQ